MNNQKGVGMIEVIIAMLILAMAVVGFALLQYRSLEMGAEALKKVEAMSVARDLGERMYAHKVSYMNQAGTGLTAGGSITSCTTLTNNQQTTFNFCNSNNFVAKDVADVRRIAAQKGLEINLLPCPATDNQRQCVYVSWGGTLASQDDENENACTEESTFVYKAGAKCIVMEAFS